MCEVINIKADIIFEVIIDLLNQGKSAVISVNGDSMYPFLRNGIDSVELSKISFSEIRRGDIVMIRRVTGAYVMHRVIRKETNRFYMVGDAQQFIEGPLEPEQLIAIVKKVWRKDQEINCYGFGWKTLAGIWLKLLNQRHFIMKVYSKVRMICSKFNRNIKPAK